MGQQLSLRWFSTPPVQITLSFVTGILFAPLSRDLTILIAWLVIYEFVYAIITRLRPELWSFPVRLAVIVFYVLGWIVGRRLFGLHVIG